jgi:hypothetical protein
MKFIYSAVKALVAGERPKIDGDQHIKINLFKK